jgi:HNH endonuclease
MGYGLFQTPEAGGYAHRYSYLLHFGAIPKGMFVCHHCDVRPCVNPAHLFIGTHAENMIDRNNKGRTSRNIVHIPQRLTADQVLSIRSEYIPRVVGSPTLAKKYGVSTTTIKQIIRREIWSHV